LNINVGEEYMAPVQPDNRRATLTFVLLCVMAFILYIDRTNIAVAAPVIGKEFGLSNTQLGVIFSAFAVAYSVFMIPGGWLSDRIGSRKGLLLYGAIWSIATMVTGMVGGLAMLAVCRFMVGVGEAPIYPTAARTITRVIQPARRGAAQGIMHGVGRGANALAPLIVTALIVVSSWRMSFVILGVTSLVFMIAMYWLLGDRKKETTTDATNVVAAAPAIPRVPINWPDMLRRVWPVTATCFCHGWVLWFFLNWIPTFFAQRYGMDIKHSALFSTFVLLGGTVGTAAGGMLSDWRLKRTGDRLRARRGLIIFGFLAAILGLIPLMFTHDPIVSSCALSFAFFCSELTDSPLWVIGSEVSATHSATSAACTFTGMALAGVVSPLVVGKLLDVTGGNWAVAFGASIVVLLLGPLLSLRIRLDDRPAGKLTGTLHLRSHHTT
jgi:MFS family permease